MTGVNEDTLFQGSALNKKSYNIADLLRDSTPADDSHTVPTIVAPYQPQVGFDPPPLLQLTISSDQVTYSDQFPNDLSPVRSASSPGTSTSTEFPSVTSGQHTSSDLPFLRPHPHPPPLSFFQSPGYISLLLANHFAQPYFHQHQRIPELNPYSVRPLILGSKRKGGQVRFAAAQTARLEREFLDHKYLHANDRKRLAQALKLTDRQVKTWFQNRRAKWRKVGVLKGHRSESDVSASYGVSQEKHGYSPGLGRSVSLCSILSEDSS